MNGDVVNESRRKFLLGATSVVGGAGVVGAAGDVEGPASVVSIADACVTGFFVGVKGVVGEVIADDKHDANASQVRRSR